MSALDDVICVPSQRQRRFLRFIGAGEAVIRRPSWEYDFAANSPLFDEPRFTRGPGLIDRLLGNRVEHYRVSLNGRGIDVVLRLEELAAAKR